MQYKFIFIFFGARSARLGVEAWPASLFRRTKSSLRCGFGVSVSHSLSLARAVFTIPTIKNDSIYTLLSTMCCRSRFPFPLGSLMLLSGCIVVAVLSEKSGGVIRFWFLIRLLPSLYTAWRRKQKEAGQSHVTVRPGLVWRRCSVDCWKLGGKLKTNLNYI